MEKSNKIKKVKRLNFFMLILLAIFAIIALYTYINSLIAGGNLFKFALFYSSSILAVNSSAVFILGHRKLNQLKHQ